MKIMFVPNGCEVRLFLAEFSMWIDKFQNCLGDILRVLERGEGMMMDGFLELGEILAFVLAA